jgi:nucleotide-binding universal stress UspA family protein
VQDIVVQCATYRDWQGSVRYAAQLAAGLRATLTGLWVRARTWHPPGPPLLIEEVSAYAQDELQQAMLAGRAFADWARQFGAADARWQVAIGEAADALCMAGDWNDLVVISAGGKPRESLRTINEVLASGTACLAVPEAYIAPGRVTRAVVAWNGTAAANRAIHAAIPLLRRAQSVVLLQPHRSTNRPRRTGWRPIGDPVAHLTRHGVAVSAIECIEGDDEAAAQRLLAAALEYHADLLVMGASGERRRSEPYFGRTTASILERSQLPLLLRH